MKRKIFLYIAILLSFMLFIPACSKFSVIDQAARNLSHYDIEAFYNSTEHTVSGKLELSFTNNFSEPLTSLVFSLWANAFTEQATYGPVSATNANKAYPNGKSYGGIAISDATVNNAAVQHIVGGQDNTSLTLPLANTIYQNQKATITLNFVSTLPNANLRFGYGENTVNITGFYPVLAVYEAGGWVANPYSSNGDPFYTNCANFDVKFTHDSAFTIAHTGSQLSQTEHQGTTKHHLQAKAVRDFAIILSKEFSMLQAKQNDVTILYYYFADTLPETSLAVACDSIKTFSSLFGAYPYPVLSVVQTNFVHGGMEFPQLVMISNTLASREQQNEVIAHEIAHQWWYGLVGSNAFAHGWMDEGLTEFSTALFFEKNPQYNTTKQQIITRANSSYLLFVDVYTEVFGTVDTSMDRPLNSYRTEPEYVYVAYVKSLLMYDNLFELIGEKKFLKALQTLVKERSFQNITPAIMIATFQKASHVKLESFFNSWISGKVAIVGK